MSSFIHFSYATDIALFVMRLSLGVIFGLHGIFLLQKWREKPSQKVHVRIFKILRLLSILEPLGGLAVII